MGGNIFFYWWGGGRSEISGVPPSQVYLNGTALIEFDIKSIGYIYQIKTNLFNELNLFSMIWIIKIHHLISHVQNINILSYSCIS